MTFIALILMIYNLTSEVTIGDKYRFNSINECRITHSIKELTDTALVSLPKNREYKELGKKVITDFIKKGDKIVIKLGYNGELRREFVGYIRRVKPSIPLVLECEDYMYVLKQKKLTKKSWSNASLKDVAAYITDGTGISFESIDANLGKFSINTGVNSAKVLEALNTTFKFVSNFQHDPTTDEDPILKIGFPYSFTIEENKPVYHLRKNVASHSLEYYDQEDVLVKIKAIANLSTGLKETFEYGDEDGEIHTRNYPPGTTKEQLAKYAEEEYKRYKVDGYRGSVTGFGIPYVKPGYAVVVYDPEYDNQRGSYLVDKVTIDYSEQPKFRRTVTIGEKAS